LVTFLHMAFPYLNASRRSEVSKKWGLPPPSDAKDRAQRSEIADSAEAVGDNIASVLRALLSSWKEVLLVLLLTNFIIGNMVVWSVDRLVEEDGILKEECADWLPPTPAPNYDPWDFVKFSIRPAKCKVNGYFVEELDFENNFRRGWALGYTLNVEDRRMLVPYFLGFQDRSLNRRNRRVLLDLGANLFNSSVEFFIRHYPVDFTEIHAFEVRAELFEVPPLQDPDVMTYPMASDSRRMPWKGYPFALPNAELQRVHQYNMFVGAAEGELQLGDKVVRVVNVTSFILDELRLTPDDTVIVKMDIEAKEWDILGEWLKMPVMAQVVDELFVEVHYCDPSMVEFGWCEISNHTRDEATRLLTDLRRSKFIVHFWP